MGGKARSGHTDDREMWRGREMKRGMKSDGRRQKEGWRSGVKDRQRGKYRKDGDQRNG